MGAEFFNQENSWIERAGAIIDGLKVELPLEFLLVPMTIATNALVDFRKSKNIADKIKFGTTVVTMVRSADTAYYRFIVDQFFKAQAKLSGNAICEHCVRGQLWPNRMKEYRRLANKNVIHKMESGGITVVNFDDLEIVEKYYNEMFEQPLMHPKFWRSEHCFTGKVHVKSCDQCLRKNKAFNKAK